MKKILLVAVAIIVAFVPVRSQSKQDARMAKKEAKLTAKQLEKEGFKLLELGDLKLQLESYLLKTKSGSRQIIGVAQGCKTLNIGIVTAKNNAMNDYATMIGGVVKGRITSTVSNVSDVQADEIVAAYERLVLKEIKGEIQSGVTLYREKKKVFDVRAYCYIDYDAAHSAKMRAMTQALEELNLTQQFGSNVSDWIDEGFE